MILNAFNKTVIDFWYRLTSYFFNPDDFTITSAVGFGEYQISRVDKSWCNILKLVFPLCHNCNDIYINRMGSRVTSTYQNISPEVTRKPWRGISPDPDIAPGLSCHRMADILVLSPEKTCDNCYVTFLNKMFTLLSNDVVGSRTRSNWYAEQIHERLI